MVTKTNGVRPQIEPWFRQRRRVILDMHIGDWDAGFLAELDPLAIADACVRARLTSLMLYAVSHVGLCYWPTAQGRMHAGLGGRDFVGELVALLRSRGIAAVGYVSVIFDNWAFLEHPEWRQQPFQKEPAQSSDELFAGGRYGLVCPNNPDYQAYVLAQIGDLYGHYEFAGAFFDMTFWPEVCQCPHCRSRFLAETGQRIPDIVDWFNPDWCAFQSARESWLATFSHALTDAVHAVRPGISVHHNFACLQRDWRSGVSCAATAASTFLGADFYGDALEQLVVCKLYQGLSREQPIEFMTTRCPTPGYHEQLKSASEMELQVLGATLASAAFMWIDAMDLNGALNPAVYERIGHVFAKSEPYEAYLGGLPAEDIGIYFGSDAKVDFRDNGKPVTDATSAGTGYPHMLAARGWARALQKAHIPFGVLTRKDLPQLDRFRALILPNVCRMTPQEADAVRAYVRRGGRLYASRYTSLVETGGVRHDDFMLADVFGCHLGADDLGAVTYVRPVDAALVATVRPQAYLDHFARPGSPSDGAGALRLTERTEGDVLACLTLPFDREWGDMFDRRWGSIHSSPPWQDTAAPVIVRHNFGHGRCIYSAADVESVAGECNEALLRHLLGLLLDAPLSFTTDAHSCVWTSVFHQPEQKRFRVCFLNHQQQLPPVPIQDVSFTLRPPERGRFTSLQLVPDASALRFSTDADGVLHGELPRLGLFAMLLAGYE